MVWPERKWTNNTKENRKLAEENYYRHFSYRDVCKKLGHATNFLGKPPTLARIIHIPQDLVEAFQERYYTAFPCIQRLQAWVAAELQTKQQLVTIHGRKRDFFDRTNADETIRQGLAYLAAAATADNLDLGMWRIWNYMPEVELLAQVHDAVYFQFKEQPEAKSKEGLTAKRIVGRAQELLTTPLYAPNGRRFTVPTDAKVGYNWGNYIPANDKEGTPERNVRGLRKFVT
jgi:hypothetical protein